MKKSDQGSMLIEILVSLVILGIAGVAMINAMTNANVAARKTQAKTSTFYQLTSAAEAYSATPYIDCSPTVANPYSLPAGAVAPNVTVSIETLTKSGTTWNWRQCGSGGWTGEEIAKVQRITVQIRLRNETCTSQTLQQNGSCYTRTFLKSDTNSTSQYAVVGGFRVWPISPVSLVWRESRSIAVKVAGIPSPNDKVIYTVTGTSAGASVLPADGGVTIVAGSTTGQFTFSIGAYDVDAKVAAAPTTLTVNVIEPLTITSSTSLTGNAGYPLTTPFQLTYRGGNGGAVTFSTSADPALFTITTDGKFNWTTQTPASPAGNSYADLVPYTVPIRLSQAGAAAATANLSVQLFGPLRVIKPAPPPAIQEIATFDVGSTAKYQLQAVGGNPTTAISFSTSATNFVLDTTPTLSAGVTSTNLAQKSSALPNVDQYTVPLTLSGAGWPTTVPYSLSVQVRPVVVDPGAINVASGQATTQNLTCTCTGATSPTFRIDSSWSGTGFTVATNGTLSILNTVPVGTYTLPVTVTARGASGTLITSGIRNITINVLNPLRLIQPGTDEILYFNHGAVTAQTLQATGGKPTVAINITTTSTQFTVAGATLVSGVTSAQLTQKSTSLPGVGQVSVPITLSGGGTTSTVSTSITVRVRPVLAAAALTGMNGTAGSSSLTGLCTCTGATTTRYSIGSTFSNSKISLSSAGLLSWDASLEAGTYTIPVTVSGANANGVFVDSNPTNITLSIAPPLVLTSPTDTQVGGFGSPPTGGFPMTATGGNGTSASFKIVSGYANASYFSVTTNTASYNASTLTSVGSITYTATAPAGTYSVPIALFGAGSPVDVSAGTITIRIQPTLAVTSTSTAACQTFNRTAWGGTLCSVTVTYTAGTGSGKGIKLFSTPTSSKSYTFLWSTSTTSQDSTTPFPLLVPANSITVYFWKTSGSSAFCAVNNKGTMINTSDTITITLQDAGSPKTVTTTVNITC